MKKWFVKVLKSPWLLLLVLLGLILIISLIAAFYIWYAKRHEYVTIKELSEVRWESVIITERGKGTYKMPHKLTSAVRSILQSNCTSYPPLKAYANQYMVEITDKSGKEYKIYFSQYAWQFVDSNWMFLMIPPCHKLNEIQKFIEEEQKKAIENQE